MGNKEQALAIVKEKGPLLPREIASSLGIDTFFAGAILSELTSEKRIKLTSLKIGGSPLYYAPEDSPKLTKFSDKLNEKDRRAYELLKERKILKDDQLTALLRVSLRNIKDFAVPLQVNYKDQQLIFWKWYLLSNTEAEPIIKKILGSKTETAPAPQEKQKKLQEETKTQPQETKTQKPKQTTQQNNITKKTKNNDEFLEKLNNYFNSSKIDILSQDVIRKNSEIDLILKVPSSIGSMEYYCKAKNKKTSNHNDLSTAFVQGQIKKLPVIYITTGRITKKAEQMLKNEFKNLIVKTI